MDNGMVQHSMDQAHHGQERGSSPERQYPSRSYFKGCKNFKVSIKPWKRISLIFHVCVFVWWWSTHLTPKPMWLSCCALMNVIYVLYFIDWLHIFFDVFTIDLEHAHVVCVVVVRFLFFLASFLFLSLCFGLGCCWVWRKEIRKDIEKNWSRTQPKVQYIG